MHRERPLPWPDVQEHGRGCGLVGQDFSGIHVVSVSGRQRLVQHGPPISRKVFRCVRDKGIVAYLPSWMRKLKVRACFEAFAFPRLVVSPATSRPRHPREANDKVAPFGGKRSLGCTPFRGGPHDVCSPCAACISCCATPPNVAWLGPNVKGPSQWHRASCAQCRFSHGTSLVGRRSALLYAPRIEPKVGEL